MTLRRDRDVCNDRTPGAAGSACDTASHFCSCAPGEAGPFEVTEDTALDDLAADELRLDNREEALDGVDALLTVACFGFVGSLICVNSACCTTPAG